MSDISKYLTEELNRLKIEDESCSREITSLNKKNTELKKKIKNISGKYDSAFNVFHAATEEELLDQNSIDELKKIVENNHSKIVALNNSKNIIEDKQKLIRKLISDDKTSNNTELNTIIDKAEFVLKLIDVDNTRAKVEVQNLINILKDFK